MIRQLREGVWWIRLGPMAPLMQNVFLVEDGGVLTLVDTGLPWTAGTLRGHIEDAGFRTSDVDRVLVTHYDLDHVGGLYKLAPEFEFAVYMGGRDVALARREHHPPLVHHKGAFHRVLRRLYPLPDQHVEFTSVDDGERIGGFRAFHTPGHNPGHTVYVHEDLGAAFLGDLVWAEDGELTTPIRFDSYDIPRLEDSIHDLNARTPPFELACMGHGEPLETGGRDALLALSKKLAPAQ